MKIENIDKLLIMDDIKGLADKLVEDADTIQGVLILTVNNDGGWGVTSVGLSSFEIIGFLHYALKNLGGDE